MGNRNWDYSTNRNSKTNEFFGGFENKGDKKYNITTIKKYFIESKKLNVWEKKVYKSLREQNLILSIPSIKSIVSKSSSTVRLILRVFPLGEILY